MFVLYFKYFFYALIYRIYKSGLRTNVWKEGGCRIIYDRIMCAGFLSTALNFPPINVRKKINEACAVIINTPTAVHFL